MGVMMIGFTWFRNRQCKKQMEVQAQLDSVAMVEHMTEIAMDSLKRAQGLVSDAGVDEVNVVKVPSYKDSLLSVARLSESELVTLENDKIEIVFNTKGAQPYSVKIKDYKAYDSTELYLIKPQMSNYDISIYAGEYINTKDFTFEIASRTDTSVTMRLPFAQGGYIQQEFVLQDGSYMVENQLSFVGMENVIPRNVSMFDIDWGVVIPRLEKGYKNEKQYSKLDYYFT